MAAFFARINLGRRQRRTAFDAAVLTREIRLLPIAMLQLRDRRHATRASMVDFKEQRAKTKGERGKESDR